MGSLPHRVVGCTIGAKKKGVKFFFKFFFRWVWVLGCGGVGARAWVLGCGRVGVGAWARGSVGGGGGMGMGGRGMRQAGVGWSLSDGADRLAVLSQPGFGLAARV